jgi:multidrug efflux pump subunit AcrA (membrane-fusion protein)
MKYRFVVIMMLGFLLAACRAQATPTTSPTVAADKATQTAASVSAGGQASASGFIVAAQEAQMAFTQAGSLKVVNFKEGDLVKAGDVLAELDNTNQQLDVTQAERTLKELTSPAAQAATEQALAKAQQDVLDTQDKTYNNLYPRASKALIDNTQGEIDLAKQALARASDAYRLVARLEDGNSRKAAALVALTNAQLRLNDLQAKLNWYGGKPTDVDAALAQANLDAAKAAVQEYTWYLSALKGEQVPAEATGTNLARLGQARDALAAAQDRLAHTRLIAPISGVVVSVNGLPGEMVSPGVVVFFISDVADLHVETTDLSERDVARVQVGQEATVSIKALGKNVLGHVTRISPVSNTVGGDVVYQTVITLDEPPAGLLVGMSVDVRYGVAP